MSTGRSSATSSPRRRPRGEAAGRVALIVGAASGIGRATARLLAARGAHVAVADLNAGAPRRSPPRSPPHTATAAQPRVEVDVTDEAAVAEMMRQTVLAFGGIDILVASAGLRPARR